MFVDRMNNQAPPENVLNDEDDIILTDDNQLMDDARAAIQQELSRNANRTTLINALVVVDGQQQGADEVRSRNNFIQSFNVSS